MRFYDITFMDVADLRLNVHTTESATWIGVAPNSSDYFSPVKFNITPGHEDRFRRACEAFNAVMAEPVPEQIAAE